MNNLLINIGSGIGQRRAITVTELEDLRAALELCIDELELELSESRTNESILEVDVLLKARIIKQLEAQLGVNNDE